METLKSLEILEFHFPGLQSNVNYVEVIENYIESTKSIVFENLF